MKPDDYNINLNVAFDFLQRIDVARMVAESQALWSNQTLCQVNDCVVRLGVLQGEFQWHKHDREDEFFFVLSGKLLLDREEGTIELGPHQGYTVPRGATHRTRAPERTVMLVFEKSSVEPTGD